MFQGLTTKWKTPFPGTNHLCFVISCHRQIPAPTPIYPPLLDLRIIQKPDWTSRVWTTLWNTISPQFSPINSKILRISKETVCCLLQQVQVFSSPSIRTPTLLVCELSSIRIPQSQFHKMLFGSFHVKSTHKIPDPLRFGRNSVLT